jgi:PAS domain S-box-containing protein
MYLLSFVASQSCIAIENQGLYEQLHQSHEYVQNIVESINNGIITIDIEDKITLFNKNATALLGIASGDIIGRTYTDELPSDIISVIKRMKRIALKNGFAQENIIEYQASNELSISIAINASQLIDAHENQIGVIFILRDMSTSKELEKLRQIDEMKSDFVSNVSHELRTPLGIVKSYVEAILNQVDPLDYVTQREFLHVVNSETDRLTELVDDLLDISKIESGKFEIELKSVSLKGIIESAIGSLEKKSPDHKIAVGIPKTLPNILADPEKLRRVFVNLIDNANKFSRKGSTIRVEVSVEKKIISISVSDDGIGISKKDIPCIFDKFYRGDTPEGVDIPGTGLGLSIVKHIINEHKGTIKVKSSSGKGTTFTILLPWIK